MNKETYIKKKQELENKFPRIMHPKFLLVVRVVISLIGFLVIKVVSGALPFYRNKCLFDNIQAKFQPLQSYLSQPSQIILVECFILFASTVLTLSTRSLMWLCCALVYALQQCQFAYSVGGLYICEGLVRYVFDTE
jgi:hypothetical protein